MYKIRQLVPLCSNCFKRITYSKINYHITPFSSQKETLDHNDDAIKYSTSKARTYKAKASRTGFEEERLWYEPYVISLSLIVFLFYFCVFREENDIDKELNRSLYSRIEGLEEQQLRLSLKYNLDKGIDTTAIRQRLEEIEEEKRAGKAISST